MTGAPQQSSRKLEGVNQRENVGVVPLRHRHRDRRLRESSSNRRTQSNLR